MASTGAHAVEGRSRATTTALRHAIDHAHAKIDLPQNLHHSPPLPRLLEQKVIYKLCRCAVWHRQLLTVLHPLPSSAFSATEVMSQVGSFQVTHHLAVVHAGNARPPQPAQEAASSAAFAFFSLGQKWSTR